MVDRFSASLRGASGSGKLTNQTRPSAHLNFASSRVNSSSPHLVRPRPGGHSFAHPAPGALCHIVTNVAGEDDVQPGIVGIDVVVSPIQSYATFHRSGVQLILVLLLLVVVRHGPPAAVPLSLRSDY